MEENDKKFSTVEIVLMMMLALMNDALMVTADLGLAIPIIGEVLYGVAWLVDAGVWALLMFWYIMKLGTFGGPALVQTVAGIAEFIGIPSRTIGVIIGTWLANHPKAAAVATIATGQIGGAEKAIGEEAVTAERAAEAGIKEAGAAAKGEAAAAQAPGMKPSEVPQGKPSEQPHEGKPSEEPQGKPSETPTEEKPFDAAQGKPEVSPEALGEKPEPTEQMKRDVFGGETGLDVPQPEKKPENEDEELPEAA